MASNRQIRSQLDLISSEFDLIWRFDWSKVTIKDP